MNGPFSAGRFLQRAGGGVIPVKPRHWISPGSSHVEGVQ